MFSNPVTAIASEVFTAMPATFARKRRSTWGDVNRRGEAMGSFLEGPCFDEAGNLFVCDIPFGRIFRITPAGEWTLVAEYDGWPNGLKYRAGGTLYCTDYKRGIMTIDVATGAVSPAIETFRTQSFKGVNDLCFSRRGDLYFTDQGQTGWHDPTGSVFRYTREGHLEPLFSGIPSPNGIVLNAAETEIYVAITRGNAVWRAPIMPDGGVSKVGCFLQLSGGVSGPDGLAMDQDGGIAVAHVGMGICRFDKYGRPTHMLDGGLGRMWTNMAFRDHDIYVTDSGEGSVIRGRWPAAGAVLPLANAD